MAEEHEHRFWTTWRCVGIWRNQYGAGGRLKHTGAACGCGATKTPDEAPTPWTNRRWAARRRRRERAEFRAWWEQEMGVVK